MKMGSVVRPKAIRERNDTVKKILWIFCLFSMLVGSVSTSSASDIVWADKIANDWIPPLLDTEKFSEEDANAIKAAVNSKLDTVATLAELIALPLPADGTIVHVAGRTSAGDGYEGDFEWDSTPCVANVTADTQKGITAAPSALPTGSGGAWWRTYAPRAINALWFGADKTGTSDSTAAIMAMLAVGKNDNFLPEGNYLVTALTLTKANQKLRGAGRSVTTITNTSNSANCIYFYPPSPSSGNEFLYNCGISDLSVTNAGTVSTGIGIYLRQVAGFTLKNVSVSRYLKGIQVAGGQLNQLSDFVLSCSGYTGAAIAGAGLLYFTRTLNSDGATYQAPFTCQVSNFSIGGATIAESCISVLACDGLTIMNGYVSWAKDYLIRINESNDTKISALTIGPGLFLDGVNTPNTDYAIYANNSSNQSMLVKIMGNIIGQTDYGIYGGTGLGTVSVSDNEFVNIPNDVVSLSGSSSALDASIVGNSFGGSATVDDMADIRIASANRVVVSGNKISGATGTGSAGINLSGTITAATIVGNLVQTCTTDLINTATISGKFVQSGNVSNCTTKILNGSILGNEDNAGTTVLDWYLEGTWTPTITIGGSSTGITYSNQVGRYTRVGNIVHFGINITLTSKGSETGYVLIEGLPYTVHNALSFPCAIRATALASGAMNQGLYALALYSSTSVKVYTGATDGSSAQITDAHLLDTSVISVSGSYRVQ